MKYLMLINQGPALEKFAAMSEDDQKAYYGAWAALNQTPGVTPGERMDSPDTATTVRADDTGATLVTDGPFAELKEAVGGYFFYEGADLDAALAVAATVPVVPLGGAVEVRPLVEQAWQ